MKIGIRADASAAIGIGHVMRCLTLADALRDGGADIFFICKRLQGDLGDYISQRGYAVHFLAGDPEPDDDALQCGALLERHGGAVDWLVVDHYGIDAGWESALRLRARKILVIDDRADRRHDCDALLDQNYYIGMERRYDGLVPPSCRQWLGPRHALLRAEFETARRRLRRRDGSVRRILVFFGGSDPTNETEKALLALQALDLPGLHADVVVGAANQQKERIEQLCGSVPGAVFHCQISHIAELMAEADLALGAGGTATWERCFLGLPTLTVTVADNQEETTAALAEAGVIWNLGPASGTSAESIRAALRRVLADPEAVREKSAAALRLMAGGEDENAHPGAAAGLARWMFAERRDDAHNTV